MTKKNGKFIEIGRGFLCYHSVSMKRLSDSKPYPVVLPCVLRVY